MNNWIKLISAEQLAGVKENSSLKPQVIFKHSTRCNISSMVQNRLLKHKLPDEIDFYFLEVPAQRAMSNTVSEDFSVQHESPQILLIKNGACIYDESHMAIDMDELIDQAKIS